MLIRLVTADAFRESGLAVIEAASADEALAYLGAGGPVDLLFSDIDMPGSLNGLDLARRLKATSPALPVILTSGTFMTQDINPVGLFVSKPYSLERAVMLVLEQLGV